MCGCRCRFNYENPLQVQCGCGLSYCGCSASVGSNIKITCRCGVGVGYCAAGVGQCGYNLGARTGLCQMDGILYSIVTIRPSGEATNELIRMLLSIKTSRVLSHHLIYQHQFMATERDTNHTWS